MTKRDKQTEKRVMREKHAHLEIPREDAASCEMSRRAIFYIVAY